jgi:uncharacterized protein (UPF0210 family)
MDFSYIVNSSRELYVCTEIFYSEQVLRNNTLKGRGFRFFKQKNSENLFWKDQSVHCFTVFPNNRLVDEPFFFFGNHGVMACVVYVGTKKNGVGD